MTDELKPCPLCGSEVGWVSGSIRCSRCGLSYGAPVSKEKVEHRWNTRAERTCRMEGDGCSPPNCSACGWQADTYDCAWLEDGRYEYDGKFCKQCGAKVVSE